MMDSPRILVVDDDPAPREMLGEALRGHAVDIAGNGMIALEKLGERSYDLILSDMRMPELDGPGLYRELERRDPELTREAIGMTPVMVTIDADRSRIP